MISQLKMDCEEKARLLAEYERTTSEYSAAVKDLVEHRGISPKVHYDELIATTHTARRRCEEARGELERHLAMHRC